MKPKRRIPIRSTKTKALSSCIKYTPLIYKEKDLCKQFYHRVRLLQQYNYFKFKFFIFHIANENISSDAYRLQLAAMGVRAGIADYCVLLPQGRVAFIEFKRNAKCKLTDKQEAFADECKELGIPFALHSNVEEAIAWIETLVPASTQ